MSNELPQMNMSVMNGMAQGEITLYPLAAMNIEAIPEDAAEVELPQNGEHIIAHSESGHHHAMKHVRFFMAKDDPLTQYIRVSDDTVLEHHKSGADAHVNIGVARGDYVIKAARESRPSGWTRAID